MTRVKICGITRPDDAKAALDAGADAIGFVFAESPRRVSIKQAEKISKVVGPWVSTVGVFVNETSDRIMETVHSAGLTAVQLHGDESPSFMRRLARPAGGAGRVLFGYSSPVSESKNIRRVAGDRTRWPHKPKLIKAIRVENQASIGDTNWLVDAVLFDTAVRGLRGGTGKTFDWKWLSRYRGQAPFIVSGGLNPANVAHAIDAARPYGVDVSGGVEKAPGIKDPRKIREFVRRAKRA